MAAKVGPVTVYLPKLPHPVGSRRKLTAGLTCVCSFPDSVFRVERGRMRNVWYPRKMAEYMTPTRFRELGLTKDDIGERDTLFGSAAANESEQDSEQTATKAAIPKSKPKPIAATVRPLALLLLIPYHFPYLAHTPCACFTNDI
jgi:hypothetical protein